MPAAIPNRISITFRLDETAHAKAKVIARMEDRPLNSQLEHWVKRCISQHEDHYGTIALVHEEQ